MPTLRWKSSRTSTQLVHRIKRKFCQWFSTTCHPPSSNSTSCLQGREQPYLTFGIYLRVKTRASVTTWRSSKLSSQKYISRTASPSMLWWTLSSFTPLFVKISIETPPSCLKTLSPDQTTSSKWRRIQQRYTRKWTWPNQQFQNSRHARNLNSRPLTIKQTKGKFLFMLLMKTSSRGQKSSCA